MTKKQYILEKAEALFAEKGFDATSVRDIAKAAGINIAMISYYFGSKEKLMEALFKMRMDIGLAFVKDIAENSTLTAFEKIERSLSGYIERVKSNTKFYHVILAEQATNKNKSIVRFLNESKKTYAVFFENLLREGKASGAIQAEVDPVFFMSTITGTIMHALLNKSLYMQHYGLKGVPGWDDDAYFERVKDHLILITKNILKY